MDQSLPIEAIASGGAISSPGMVVARPPLWLMAALVSCTAPRPLNLYLYRAEP
jgi:hypothetical protein